MSHIQTNEKLAPATLDISNVRVEKAPANPDCELWTDKVVEYPTPETGPFSDVVKAVFKANPERKRALYMSTLHDKVMWVDMPTKEEASLVSERVENVLMPAIRENLKQIHAEFGSRMTKEKAKAIINLKLREANALVTANRCAIISETVDATESLESNIEQMKSVLIKNSTSGILNIARKLMDAADDKEKGALKYVR